MSKWFATGKRGESGRVFDACVTIFVTRVCGVDSSILTGFSNSKGARECCQAECNLTRGAVLITSVNFLVPALIPELPRRQRFRGPVAATFRFNVDTRRTTNLRQRLRSHSPSAMDRFTGNRRNNKLPPSPGWKGNNRGNKYLVEAGWNRKYRKLKWILK